MRAVRIKAGKKPEVIDIPNELDALQEEVGGYIETTATKIEGVIMLVNEEGRLPQYTPEGYKIPPRINPVATFFSSGMRNHWLTASDPNVIVGDAVMVAVDGEEFTDITAHQLRLLQAVSVDYMDWDPFDGRANE